MPANHYCILNFRLVPTTITVALVALGEKIRKSLDTLSRQRRPFNVNICYLRHPRNM